jgi:peptide deformylase
MKAKVLVYGSPTLRKHAEKIDEIQPELVKNLFDTLAVEGGIGLAAPQIGVLQRVFIISTEPLADDDPSVESFKRVVFNPVIIEVSEETSLYNEGCLSIPELYEMVERPKSIRVKYLDEEMNEVTRKIDGIEARIFQHEYDHLEGILFVDRISSIRKAIIASKLKRLQRLSKKR